MTGVDQSAYSINYAKSQAEKTGLAITYILRDYREPFAADGFDAAVIISEDYGVLSPADRARFLGNVYAALRPGGKFALDVSSERAWEKLKENTGWYTQESGFLRPHPHVVLTRTWLFP